MPEFITQNWFIIILVYTTLTCVLPIVALGIGVYIAYRRGSGILNSIVMPDVEQMQISYEKLRARYPDKSADALVATIIHRQSLRCGFVGAVTGVTGLVTLPIALPVDMVMSYRIQGAMVNFIARAYNHNSWLPGEEETMASVVVFGTSQFTQAGTKAAMNLVIETLGKVLAKVIPFAGAIIGFVVNYFTTQATGRLAASLYSGQVQSVGLSTWQRVRKVFGRGKREENEKSA